MTLHDSIVVSMHAPRAAEAEATAVPERAEVPTVAETTESASEDPNTGV